MNNQLDNIRLHLLTSESSTFDYTQCDVILERGEAFYDLVSGQLFIGDGSHAVKDLPPIGSSILNKINQEFTAVHTLNSSKHIFTIEQKVPTLTSLIPVAARFTADYQSGQAAQINLTFTDNSVTTIEVPAGSIRMTNGYPAVTKVFYNNTVGQFYIYITYSQGAISNTELYFISATAVWAD